MTGQRGKIPILVSVSLRNLCPAPINDEETQVKQSGKNKKRFREYAASLLHQVRLDIVIAPQHESNRKGGKYNSKTDTGTGEEKVIFSSLAPVKTINPSWNHLDEYIEDYLALDGYFDSDTGFYRFMRLRIWLVPEDKRDDNDEANFAKGFNDDAEQSFNQTNDELKKKKQEPLLDISIHPTKLQRLAKIPQQLPINAILLHFSDGSVRATKSLLDIVGDQNGSHADENLKDEFGRFGDGAFNLLDQVTPVKKSPSSKRECVYSDLSSRTYSEDSQDGSAKKNTNASLDQSSQSQLSKKHQDILSKTQNGFTWTEDEVTNQDSSVERKELDRLIRLEETALEEELRSVYAEKSELQSLMERASQIEANMNALEDVVEKEIQLCRESVFFLEARRVKLLRDVRHIYPISILPTEEKYCIRDLRIPFDIHSGTVAEDELSAAFGFLCHLVSLVSKYLSVQLRHNVFCNSSRSAIQDDSGIVLPLFMARAVEREQFDYALCLLHRNVECILKTREIQYEAGEHILVNTKRLFDKIVEGVD